MSKKYTFYPFESNDRFQYPTALGTLMISLPKFI